MRRSRRSRVHARSRRNRSTCSSSATASCVRRSNSGRPSCRVDVTFAGFQQGEALLECFAAADIFVLLSHRETWGVVVNEAAAFGLPLILTDRVGAAGDLLRDGENGALVRSGDIEGAARAIAALADDPERRRRFGTPLARARCAVGLRAERRDVRRGGPCRGRRPPALASDVEAGAPRAARPASSAAASRRTRGRARPSAAASSGCSASQRDRVGERLRILGRHDDARRRTARGCAPPRRRRRARPAARSP